MTLDRLSKLYPYCPLPVQNIGLTVYGLFYRAERLGGSFSFYVDEFRERETWTSSRFNEYLNASVNRLLRHAFEEVPFYKENWKKAGITEKVVNNISAADLHRLPVTTKKSVRDDPYSFVSNAHRSSRSLLQYHTSGSTGTPLTCVCNAEAHRRFIAAREARSFGWAKASIRMPRSMIGGRRVVPQASARPPYYRYNWAERQLYCSAYHIRPDSAKSYLEGFHRYRPLLFTGYASAHYLLAQMLDQQGMHLGYQPQALVLSSEKLTSEMKDVIQRVFQARAYEEYGAVENCALATECEHGRLHCNPDFGILEIVDDDGAPLGPGRTGRVLCTGLQNAAQLLIRYEIGDLARWAAEPCPCGRSNLPVIEEIVGRVEDVITTRDGRRMVRFHGIFINLPGVIAGQVVQEALDSYSVRIVANQSYGRTDEDLIRSRMASQVGDVSVRVERVDELERTPGGKLKAVISHLSPK